MLKLTCRNLATGTNSKEGFDTDMNEKDFDAPLSQSSVTLKLELIQQRCSELMDDPDGLELSLDEPAGDSHSGDPYNHQS